MIKNLYYDFTCCYEIAGNFGKYSGATNYAIVILKKLIEKNNGETYIHLVMPKSFEAEDLFEIKSLSFCDGLNVAYVDSIEYLKMSEESLLFIPAVYGRNLVKIPEIKRNNPSCTIYATLHDRQHNYYRYDWMDRIYHGNNYLSEIPKYLRYKIRKLVFDYIYNRCVGYIDMIFTVSNFSMQMLQNRNANEMKFFVQGNVMDNYKGEISRGNYVLMVGGGREEKNLLRTLLAFCNYKSKTRTDLRFVVTGVKDDLINKIRSYSKIDKNILDKSVEFKGYVEYADLATLYAQCKFVIFSSKGEGFGLPVLEALSYRKVVLASQTTSIPEVAGAAIRYCDPFSIKSIFDGIKFLDDDNHLNKLEQFVSRKYELVKRNSSLDLDILISELKGY